MNLKAQLSISFYALVGLMFIVPVLAYMGLVNGQKNFVEYRELARVTNLTARLQSNMPMTRLNIFKYIDSDSPATLNNYTERVDKMRGYLQQAKIEIQQPQRTTKIKEPADLIDQYTNGFDEIVQLIAQRHQVVNQDLDPSGLSMR